MEENTHICSDCNEIITGEVYENDEGGEICEGCSENYITCCNCDNIIHKDNAIWDEGGYNVYCESCYDDIFTRCVRCDCEIERDNAYIGEDDNEYYCNDCYNDNYTSCENCGDYHHFDNMTYIDEYDGYYCENCYAEFMEGNVIKGYHNRDIPITLKYLDTEILEGMTKDDLIYFGTETEVENKGGSISNNEMARKIRQEFRELELVFEEDGSLNNGFEIISQPMTMNYIKANKDKFKKMFEMLQENGFASHDTRTCGLHIHFSRVAFKDDEEKCLQKLALFFDTFKEEIKTFSRRKDFNWCSFASDNMKNSSINDRYLKSGLVLKDYYKDNASHHIAINNGNTNTIEIRIFKGTLKFETYMASLEFVNNLILSIKNKNTRKISFNNVINYKDTEYLKEYCESKNIYNGTYLNDETKNVFKELDTKRKKLNDSNKVCKDNIIDITKKLMKISSELNDILNNENLELNQDLIDIYNTIGNINDTIKNIVSSVNNTRNFIDNDTNIAIENCYKEYLGDNSCRALNTFKNVIENLKYISCYDEIGTKEKIRELITSASELYNNIQNNINNNVEGVEL